MAENYFPSSPSVPPFIEGGQSSSDPENPTGTGFYPRPTPRFKWTPDLHHRFLEAIQIALILACGGLLLSSSLAETVQFPALNCRKHTGYLTDFGGKGDGKTLNTAAFQSAIANLSKYASDGGAQLIVPPGKWLTGPFNLTSHFTLYIHKDAVIIGTQDISEYAIIPPLPSYGQGRDAPGPRMISLVFGTNLTDVVITGGNGTIDGQGEVWWEKFRKKELTYTRPYLIEIMYSNQIQISNLTLLNSPSWVVHPVYSSDIVIQDLTILAPIDSENTDGIDPDSCSNVRIWDNYIVSGDDCIAVKSGWDEYGIAVGMPTKHLSIKRLTCISPFSATIALGSEMSGGIQDVRAEDLKALNTESGVRIKTAPGRGGFVKDIYVRNAEYHTMKYVFWVSGEYNSHPDKGFDPTALPNITGINYSKINAKNVTIAGKLIGLEEDPFTGICISDATIEMRAADDDDKPKPAWNCTDISGVASSVTPKPCGQLVESQKPVVCEFPTDKLPIENVELTTCSAVIS
nr:probable polygalacturonase [Ipomoea batatas]